jgi:hypothetical protein
VFGGQTTFNAEKHGVRNFAGNGKNSSGVYLLKF